MPLSEIIKGIQNIPIYNSLTVYEERIIAEALKVLKTVERLNSTENGNVYVPTEE